MQSGEPLVGVVRDTRLRLPCGGLAVEAVNKEGTIKVAAGKEAKFKEAPEDTLSPGSLGDGPQQNECCFDEREQRARVYQVGIAGHRTLLLTGVMTDLGRQQKMIPSLVSFRARLPGQRSASEAFIVLRATLRPPCLPPRRSWWKAASICCPLPPQCGLFISPRRQEVL